MKLKWKKKKNCKNTTKLINEWKYIKREIVITDNEK